MSNYQEEHINIWSGNRIIFILEISLVRVTLVFSVSWKSLCVAFDYWNHYVNRCSPYFYKFWNCTKISEKASTMIALLFQRVFKLWQMLYSRKWKKNPIYWGSHAKLFLVMIYAENCIIYLIAYLCLLVPGRFILQRQVIVF